MKPPVSIEGLQRRKALNKWISDCKKRMGLRFPKIDFDSENWLINTIYETDQLDLYLKDALLDLAHVDDSYSEVFRCLAAEDVLAGKPKDIRGGLLAFKVFSIDRPQPIFHLNIRDLRRFETSMIDAAKEDSKRSSYASKNVAKMERITNLLARKGVIQNLGYFRGAEFKSELRTIQNARDAERNMAKEKVLDHQIEASNEAFNVMIENPLQKDGTPLLTPGDRAAICALCISLCAPARINEVLTMSLDDYITVIDYVDAPANEKELSTVQNAHKMLIITQKGSKGAEWGPKPVLQFMIDVFHYCISEIKELGARSRLLVEWYEKHPQKLYLPPSLEHLRGQNINHSDLAKVISLTPHTPHRAAMSAGTKTLTALKSKCFKAPNPNTTTRSGGTNPRKTIQTVRWVDAEEYLLAQVHTSIRNIRRVTAANHYKGDLSKMLFLFDANHLPFLPNAINYQYLRRRLKRLSTGVAGYEAPPTVFEKLNITMPVDGKVQFAELSLHDPRRWLTTQALKYGENLSDVLINKWANRCSLSQLQAYDFRTSEMKAEASAMPETQKIKQLSDVSNGLYEAEKLESKFGLKTAIITAQNAGIAVTSMDAIIQAVDDRPIAKSSRGVIVIYPQRFGACLHQHHEKPCRNYSNDLSASCMTCNDGVHVKGHIPTNEATRRLDEKLFTSIIHHLENLAQTHNRQVADDPEALGEHMVMLIEKGLNNYQLEKLANHLIDSFHNIKDLLKDRLLANRLKQAFVARGVVQRLDNENIANGALIKYHNPTSHSQPLTEIALEEGGGRKKITRDEVALMAKYPIFSPIAEELNDERHVIKPDEGKEGI